MDSSSVQPSVPQRFRRRPKGMIVGKLKAVDLLSSERPEGWWETRTEAVRVWLDTNPLRIGVPNDGTVEAILAACERGNRFEQAREKCWTHILLELEGIAALDVHLKQNAGAERTPMLSRALDEAVVSTDTGCQTDGKDWTDFCVAKTNAIADAQHHLAPSGSEAPGSCAALAIDTGGKTIGTVPDMAAGAVVQHTTLSPSSSLPTSPCRGRLRPSQAAALEVGKAPKSEAKSIPGAPN